MVSDSDTAEASRGSGAGYRAGALEIFAGPFQPSLEEAFIARIRKLAPGLDRSVAVVTPSRRMADRLERLLCLDAGLSLVNVRFHSFQSLTQEVVESAGRLDREMISDGLFHDKLVDRLLRERRGGRPAPKGLAKAYRKSMRDLVDAGLDPANIEKGLIKAFTDEAARTRMKDLLELLQLYYEELKLAGVLPPSALARAAAAAVRDGRGKVLENYVELVYYGFYDLTGVQGDFFQAVTSNHPCSVFFPYRKEHPAFRFAEKTLSSPMLRHSAAAPVHLEAGSGTRALGTALDRIWDPVRPEPARRCAGLEVLSVSGMRDEVWRVAKEILALTERARDPVPFERIGVVARVLEPYRAAVFDIFDEHRIPFAGCGGEPLLHHPVAKLGLSLLTWAKRQYPAATVLDIVNSPYFRKDGKSRREEYLRDWRRLIERQGVHSGWLQWEGKIGAFAAKDYPLKERSKDECLPRESNAALWEALKGFKESLAPDIKPGDWAEMARRARRVLEENFEVEKRPANEGARGGAGAAWTALLDAVSSLEYFGKALPDAGWEEFLEVLEERLGAAVVDEPREVRGVRVLSAMDARGEGFRVVFMLGLKQGMFPRQIREDPFLKDKAARRVLRQTWGYWISELISDGYEEERLLFYLIAASASDKVYAMLPRSSDEGRAQTPSTYLRELCRVCGRPEEGGDAEYVPRLPAAKIEKLAADAPGQLSPKEILVALSRAGDDARPFLERLSGWPESWDGRLLDACRGPVKELTRGAQANERDGTLPREDRDIRKLLDERADGRFSASTLGRYLGCPFHYYARAVLRLREDDMPAESGELNRLSQGELYHAALEMFHQRLLKEKFWDRPDMEAWRAALDESVEAVLGGDNWRSIGVYPLLWESLRDAMRFFLLEAAEIDMRWLIDNKMRPVATERWLEAQKDKLKLGGKIDRIDQAAGGKTLRIVDYKSRHKRDRPVRASARKMWELQPAVYSELLCGSGDYAAAPADLWGTLLLPIESCGGGPDIGAWSLSGADWRLARERFLKNLRAVQGLVRGGYFAITPQEGFGSACDRCHFARACRKAHPATRWRSERGWGMKILEEARDVPELGGKKKPAAGKAAEGTKGKSGRRKAG